MLIFQPVHARSSSLVSLFTA